MIGGVGGHSSKLLGYCQMSLRDKDLAGGPTGLRRCFPGLAERVSSTRQFRVWWPGISLAAIMSFWIVAAEHGEWRRAVSGQAPARAGGGHRAEHEQSCGLTLLDGSEGANRDEAAGFSEGDCVFGGRGGW